jgi:hypothetical protein
MAKAPNRRVIMRIEIQQGGPEALAEVVSQFGSTNVSVVSRLMMWFVDQPEEIQSAVLGHLPGGQRPDISKMLMERIAGKKSKS